MNTSNNNGQGGTHTQTQTKKKVALKVLDQVFLLLPSKSNRDLSNRLLHWKLRLITGVVFSQLFSIPIGEIAVTDLKGKKCAWIFLKIIFLGLQK